jgi:hypothetical protein
MSPEIAPTVLLYEGRHRVYTPEGSPDRSVYRGVEHPLTLNLHPE